MERMRQEERFVASRRGKWSQPGVPHRGWTCVDVEDLGEPQMECEMCESQAIRYVHRMEHPVYSQVLRVGCVCAGNMEGDPAVARTRESAMQSRAGKRKRWLTRRWSARSGSLCIRVKGSSVIVYRGNNFWRALVISEGGSAEVHLCKKCASSDEAKLAAFDYLFGGSTEGPCLEETV